MDCIFCKIVKGELPSYTIYEDEIVKVFLDINPSTNGDILVIPKKHIVTLFDLDNETLIHMHKVIKETYPIIKEKLNCDGLTVVQNNEYGQEVKHFHIHLTPRYRNDGLEHNYNKDILKSIEEIHNILTK